MMKVLSGACLCAALAAAGPAAADETLVTHLFQQRFPGTRVENVARAPLGLYEVYAGGRIWYVDGNVDYVIAGNLIDARSRRNLTAERLQRLAAVPLARLPLDLAVRVVQGNGSRRIAVFETPECAYCRQLDRELARVGNLTLYVFLLPEERRHPGSTVVASRIWCAGDRAAAWERSEVQGGQLPGPEGCPTPFAEIAGLARRYRITGAPTMIFEDGSRIAGALSATQVELALDTVQRRGAEARLE